MNLLSSINRLLKPLNLILVPRTSAKMLTETANITEQYWNNRHQADKHIVRGLHGPADNQGPSRNRNTVVWLRRVAEMIHKGGDEYK